MLSQHKPSLELLFSQLGLANSAAAIELYIRTHQLPAHQSLHDAPFWNSAQRALLISITTITTNSMLDTSIDFFL